MPFLIKMPIDYMQRIEDLGEPFKIKTHDGYSFSCNKKVKIGQHTWFFIEEPKEHPKAHKIFLKSDILGETQIILYLHDPSKTYNVYFLHSLLPDNPYVTQLHPKDFTNKDDALQICYNLAKERGKLIFSKGMSRRKLLNHKKNLFNIQKSFN